MPVRRSSERARTSAKADFSIGEAADILGVSVPTLRLYEREGLIIPYRKDSRHRRFSDVDIERIRFMRRMITEEKVSIAGIRHLLAIIPCWRLTNCSDTARTSCAAFSETSRPSWLATEKKWDRRSAKCRECPAYTQVSDFTTLKHAIVKFTLAQPENKTTPPARKKG